MISFKSRHLSILLMAFVMLINTSFATAKPSRKLKRVDQVVDAQAIIQSTVPQAAAAAVSSPLVLPANGTTTAPASVSLPAAATPLLAMALLQLMMLQSNPQSVPTPQMAMAYTDTFGEPCPNSSSSTSEDPIEAPAAGPIEQTQTEAPIPEPVVTKPEAADAVIPETETIARPVEPPQNQCTNYSGAGSDLGKSAGAISIDDSACNTEVIGMDYVITNSHCLEGTRGRAKAVFGLGQGQKKRAFDCQKVAARNPKNVLDYAVIKCPGVGKHFPPVQIANRKPQIGEPIRIATHNFTESGRIRKLINSGKVMPTGFEGDSMATTAYGEPGNSGSGIYDKDGKWLGILWGGIHDRGGKPTFFTPANKIVKDLENRYPDVANQIKADGLVVVSCQASNSTAQSAKGIQ